MDCINDICIQYKNGALILGKEGENEMDEQMERQEQKFLSFCSARDRDLITGKAVMGLADFNRLTYLMGVLDYFECMIIMYQRFPELYAQSVEQSHRQGLILEEYPDYFKDEGIIDDFDRWMEDFLLHVPVVEQTKHIREVLQRKLMCLSVN